MRVRFVASALLVVATACSGAAVSVPQDAGAKDAPASGGPDASPLAPQDASPATMDSASAMDGATMDAHSAPPGHDASDGASPADASQCTSGQTSCAGQTPETCVGGQWQFAPAPCSGATPLCLNGVCGACSPMQVSCGQNADAGPSAMQVCDATGQWQNDGTSCPYGCTAGKCGPLELVDDAMPLGAGIASDGSNVYWFSGFEAATINACPVGGCGPSPATIATNVTPNAFFGNLLALSDAYVYWPNGATVAVAPLAAGAQPTVFAPGSATSSPFQVVVEGATVYWSDSGTAAIYQCATGASCASPVTLVGAPSTPDGGTVVAPQLVAVDGTFVYWSDTNGNVNSMALAGGPTVLIAAGTSPSSLVGVAGRAYWTGANAVYSCPANTACTNVFDPDPGSNLTSLATDGTTLYWSDAAGSILKCALGSVCANPTVMAEGVDTPSMLAVDSKSLFWLAGSATGEVFEYAK